MTRYSCLAVSFLFLVGVAGGFSPLPLLSSSQQARHHRRSTTSLQVLNDVEINEDKQGPTSKTFFDVVEDHEGEVCLLSDHDQATVVAEENIEEQRFWKTVHRVVRLVPIVTPILAYFTYEELASSVNLVEDFLDSQRAWIAVDGGAYQAKIIAPAVNGVVVPSISILFATLISNTVSSLRQRILDIREAINMEAGDLRVLTTMVDAYPSECDRDKCRSYLIQYTSRLIAESRPGVKVNSLEPTGMDSEMYGMLGQLNEITKSDVDVPGSLLSESYGAVMRLNNERCRRISALQSTYPSLHFIIVSMLAVSICVAFLMETNQELLIFLNSIQLRILWTMLIGTFSALATICYDLCDPFAGSNKVRTVNVSQVSICVSESDSHHFCAFEQLSKSVNQLVTIRSALRASLSLEPAEEVNGEQTEEDTTLIEEIAHHRFT